MLTSKCVLAIQVALKQKGFLYEQPVDYWTPTVHMSYRAYLASKGVESVQFIEQPTTRDQVPPELLGEPETTTETRTDSEDTPATEAPVDKPAGTDTTVDGTVDGEKTEVEEKPAPDTPPVDKPVDATKPETKKSESKTSKK